MNCPKCNIPLDEGNISCPSCGTAIESTTTANPVDKKDKALSIAAFVLYGLAVLILITFIVIFIINPSNPSSKPTANNTSSDNKTEMVTIPENHPSFTDMNDTSAKDLFDMYENFCGGRCIDETIELEPLEVEKLFGDLGIQDDPELYSVFKYANHSSFDEVDRHIKLYITDDLYNKCYPHTNRNDKLDAGIDMLEHNGCVYIIHGPVGGITYNYVKGSLYEKDGIWYARFYANEPQVFIVVSYIKVGNYYKICSAEEETSSDTHVPYWYMDEDAAGALFDTFRNYDWFGTCSRDFTIISGKEKEEIATKLGKDNYWVNSNTLYRMNNCHSIAAVESHIKLHLTDKMIASMDPPGDNLDDQFFRFEYEGDLYFGIAAMGLGGFEPDYDSMKYDSKKDCYILPVYYEEYGERSPYGTFTIIMDTDGMYKIDSFARGTINDAPVQNTTPQVERPDDETVHTLLGHLNEYLNFHVCNCPSEDVCDIRSDDSGYGLQYAASLGFDPEEIYNTKQLVRIPNHSSLDDMYVCLRKYISSDVLDADFPDGSGWVKECNSNVYFVAGGYDGLCWEGNIYKDSDGGYYIFVNWFEASWSYRIDIDYIEGAWKITDIIDPR